MKTLGQFLQEAKATYCGRCGTRHVPPSKGGTCPALKEGSMPTADEPTEADKKTAQKVRDLLAKEKKPMKESAEDKHFEKQSPKMQTAINHHLRKGLDYLGAVKAAQKHVKEDVEQIQELGGDQHYGDTRGATSRGAKGTPITSKKMSDAALAGLEKEMQATRQTSASVAQARKKYGVSEGMEQIDEIKVGDFVKLNTSGEKHIHRVFGKQGNTLSVGKYHGPDSYGGTKTLHVTKVVKVKKPINEETDSDIRKTKVMHKGQHVATVSTYRGRAGGWLSQAENPDGSSAHKKYGIGLIDTKKEILKKIKNYHKENQ